MTTPDAVAARVKRRTLALLLITALAGCALGPKFVTPRLSVVDVQILGGTLWEQRLKVHMRVQNPNERALAVKGLEYTLDIAGERLASGLADESFVVPAMGEAEFDTTLTTNLAGTLLTLIGRGPDALAQSVPYRLAGKISLSQGLLRSIPFEERGEFRLQ